MPNRSSIFNFRNRDPLTAILLFAVMAVIIETALSFLPPNTLVKLFQANRNIPASVDFEVMGDSVAQWGIDADDLSKTLPSHKTVFNHAIAGSGPVLAYFVLKRQVDSGHPPKAVIYAPSPHTFASLRIPLLVGAFCNWSEIREMCGTGRQSFEILYGIFCRLSYTLRYREQIAEILKGRKPMPGIVELVEPRPNASSQEKAGTRFPKEQLHPMYRKKFTLRRFNAIFLERFFELARKNGIKVYWATMPVLPVVHESREPFDFDKDYYAYLEDLQRRYGIECLQKEFLLFDESEFKDSTHLNELGAAHFTRVLGEELSMAEKKAIAGERPDLFRRNSSTETKGSLLRGGSAPVN